MGFAHSSAVIVIVAMLAFEVHTYSQFEPNCSLPPQPYANFVASPNTRGTLQILWSSLFTIISCTWTIQHLNVPAQEEIPLQKNQTSSWRWSLNYQTNSFWTNLKWMFFTVLAPEYILGK